MSSLHDPFDLIEKGKDMDNVIPFLAPNKINTMIDKALAHPQLAPQKKPVYLVHKTWFAGAVGIAACILILLNIMPATTIPVMQQPVASQQMASATADDDGLSDFSELVMLDTWDLY